MSDDGIVRILITTDNHLGYMEKDPVRSEDSFAAFEEVSIYYQTTSYTSFVALISFFMDHFVTVV